MTIQNIWTQTPKEWFSCIVPTHTQDNNVTLEVLPFKTNKKPLEGTSYTYQLALSDSSVSHDAQQLHKARPRLPLSGDRRCGILVFDGQKIVASYVIPGHSEHAPRRVIVHRDYRGQKLAQKMLEQWYKEVPTIVGASKQPINVAAIKTFLAAIKNVVAWAATKDLTMDPQVRDAWASGAEAAEIIAKVQAAEEAPTRRRRSA